MAQINTCSRCQARWTAHDACHCDSCHHTFSSLTAFEAHRRANTCRTPQETGLVLLGRAYPCYGRPTAKTTAPWLNPAGDITSGAV